MSTVNGLLNDCWNLILSNLPKTLSLRNSVTWKSDGSPVTEADIFHEKLIGQFLTRFLNDYQLIAEESYKPGTELTKEWVVVLDPIDGTENFCSGLKEWGVAISMWRSGKHEGSALMLPELGDYISSGHTIKKQSSRIVGLSSSYSKKIGNTIKEVRESRIMGCAVYNLFNVIRGSYSQFLNPKGAYCWDLQAGAILALDAGCEVFIDEEVYDGYFLNPNMRHRIDIRNIDNSR